MLRAVTMEHTGTRRTRSASLTASFWKSGFAMIAMGIALSGCSALQAINPFASKPAPRNPPAPLASFTPSLSTRTAWTVRIGAAGSYNFTPAVAGDSVYAAGSDGAIARIESATGRVLWRINAGLPLTAGVGADGNTVVVGGAEGTVIAFDRDGKQRWKVRATSEILSAPAVGQGIVIVRSLDNRIAAYDEQTGERRWVIQRTAPALTLRTSPGITINGTTAYIALPAGRLLAVSTANGAQRWEAIVGEPRGTTELERIADVSGFPVVVAGEVCAVSYQGRVACFDAVSGNARWSKPLSSTVGVAADERFLFAADEHGVLNAFTRDAGASVWRSSTLANRGLSAPVSYGRAVAVGDFEGYLHFFSREDGKLLARVATDGSRIIGTPTVDGSNIFVQTQAGNLVAIAAE